MPTKVGTTWRWCCSWLEEARLAHTLPAIAGLARSPAWLPAGDGLPPELRPLLPPLRAVSREVGAALSAEHSANRVRRLRDAQQQIADLTKRQV
ncbi:MAG: hypothetical protein EI684_08320 [Candidatus Viridilinea halotolerans]|uniref:Uncharacterized protein n=1 Tax=Candidatus Viridilinea halotolerans TaxID=2491704 RepID=A0A426U2H9_9CHLR|nr:MAG: hypothetical protein EI684_08320 [Candidatus Viridilinea halotolerans]